MSASWRRLARDRRGVAAVEFALVAPALLLFLVGILELSIMIFVGSTLEAAVLTASRFGVTGGAAGEVSREDHIRAIIEDRTFGLVDMEDTTISTRIYPSFGDIGRPEPFTDANGNGRRDGGEAFSDTNGNGAWDQDMGVAGAGGPGDIVLYEVEYATQGVTTFMRPILGPITHRAAVAVRNEPF